LALLAALALLACLSPWPVSAAVAPSPPLPELSVAAPTPEVAELVREVAAEVGPRLGAWLGAAPARVRVVVAGSVRYFEAQADLIDAPHWAAGLAVAERGLILVRSPKLLTGPEQFRPLLVHELTHLYLSAALRQRDHPWWLEEGLAMYASGESSLERGTVMAEAVLQKRLIPFSELERGFPGGPDQAALAYAQAYYFVSYLIREYGQEVLPNLVGSLARGRDLTAALKEATGKGLYALGKDFAEDMESRFSWIALISAGGVLWTAISLVAAVGLVRRRRQQRARILAMDDPGAERVQRHGRRWPPPEHPVRVLGSAGLDNKGSGDNGGDAPPPAREGGRD
jgi:hypothetical protein